MAQKIIKVIGTSEESFAKAAANAVAEAAKTIRNLKWARVTGLEWNWMARTSPSTGRQQTSISISKIEEVAILRFHNC